MWWVCVCVCVCGLWISREREREREFCREDVNASRPDSDERKAKAAESPSHVFPLVALQAPSHHHLHNVQTRLRQTTSSSGQGEGQLGAPGRILSRAGEQRAMTQASTVAELHIQENLRGEQDE